MTYAYDFLETWLGCDLIVGASSRVPTKREAVEAIGAVTPIGKGREKRIKQEKVKEARLEESAKSTKAGPETKKRKTGKSQEQLVIFEEPENVSSPIVGKGVGHLLVPRTRVKTKVEFSLSQVLVSSSAHGSLGSPDFVAQSPLGSSGCTHNKQKTLEDSIDRERRARSFSLSPLYISFIFSLLLLL